MYDKPVTDAELDQFYGAEQEPKGNINGVTSAIRALGKLSLEDVAQILDTLTAQMVESKFSANDVDAMDEVRGYVCGE